MAGLYSSNVTMALTKLAAQTPDETITPFDTKRPPLRKDDTTDYSKRYALPSKQDKPKPAPTFAPEMPATGFEGVRDNSDLHRMSKWTGSTNTKNVDGEFVDKMDLRFETPQGLKTWSDVDKTDPDRAQSYAKEYNLTDADKTVTSIPQKQQGTVKRVEGEPGNQYMVTTKVDAKGNPMGDIQRVKYTPTSTPITPASAVPEAKASPNSTQYNQFESARNKLNKWQEAAARGESTDTSGTITTKTNAGTTFVLPGVGPNAEGRSGGGVYVSNKGDPKAYDESISNYNKQKTDIDLKNDMQRAALQKEDDTAWINYAAASDAKDSFNPDAAPYDLNPTLLKTQIEASRDRAAAARDRAAAFRDLVASKAYATDDALIKFKPDQVLRRQSVTGDAGMAASALDQTIYDATASRNTPTADRLGLRPDQESDFKSWLSAQEGTFNQKASVDAVDAGKQGLTAPGTVNPYATLTGKKTQDLRAVMEEYGSAKEREAEKAKHPIDPSNTNRAMNDSIDRFGAKVTLSRIQKAVNSREMSLEDANARLDALAEGLIPSIADKPMDAVLEKSRSDFLVPRMADWEERRSSAMDWMNGGWIGRQLDPGAQAAHDKLAAKFEKEKRQILAQADAFKQSKQTEFTGSQDTLNERKSLILTEKNIEDKIDAIKKEFHMDEDKAWDEHQTELYSGNLNSYFHPDEFERDQQAPYRVNEPQTTALGRLFDARPPDKNQLFAKDKADLDDQLSSNKIDENTYNAKLDALVTTKHQGEMQGDYPEYSSALEYRRDYAKLHSSLKRGKIDSIQFQTAAKALENTFERNKKDAANYISGYNALEARKSSMHPDKYQMLLKDLRDKLSDDNPRVSREVARQQKGQDNFLEDYLRDYKTTTTADFDKRVSALPTKYNPFTWLSGSPEKQRLANKLKLQQDAAEQGARWRAAQQKEAIHAQRRNLTDLSQ